MKFINNKIVVIGMFGVQIIDLTTYAIKTIKIVDFEPTSNSVNLLDSVIKELIIYGNDVMIRTRVRIFIFDDNLNLTKFHKILIIISHYQI